MILKKNLKSICFISFKHKLIYSYNHDFEHEVQLTTSSGLNHKAISRSAESTASEPWMMLRPFNN